MKIKKGEWYRWTDGSPNAVYRAVFDSEDHRFIRVISPRDAKPRRTIKASEALAWLMAQKNWGLVGSADVKGHTFKAEAGRALSAYGETITKAIIALRKAMGVK